MKSREALSHAAETILTQCLSLPTGSELPIVVDETTLALGELLLETATQLQHQSYLLYFPKTMQSHLAHRNLPETIVAALNDATATILCVNADAAGFSFREQVRRAAL